MSIRVAALALALSPAVPALQEQEPSLSELREAASAAYAVKDWAQAESTFTAIVDRSSGDRNAWSHLGLCRMRLGDFEGSLDASRRAAELAEKAKDLRAKVISRYNVACALSLMGDVDESVAELDGMMEEAPPDLRMAFHEASESDSDLERVRNDDRFALVMELLIPTVSSSVRTASYSLVGSARGTPFDAGLLKDGRVLLYLDRNDYRSPGSPFVADGEHEPFLSTFTPESLAGARSECSRRLPTEQSAPDPWSKARLIGQLLRVPSGVISTQDGPRIFLYFYDPAGVVLIEDRVVKMIELLLEQQVGRARVGFDELEIPTAEGMLAEFKQLVQHPATFRTQFDVLFGYDPFAALVVSASQALHAKDLIEDPRDPHAICDQPVLRDTRRPTALRFLGSVGPGVVETSWPARIGERELKELEDASRATLESMRKTEELFITMLDAEIPDHSDPAPDVAFWTFFRNKDWTWWRAPKLIEAAKRNQASPAVQALFGHKKEPGGPTLDFADSWKTYFDELNASLRQPLSVAMARIAGREAEEALIAGHPESREEMAAFASWRGEIWAAISCYRTCLTPEQIAELVKDHPYWSGELAWRSEILGGKGVAPISLQFLPGGDFSSCGMGSTPCVRGRGRVSVILPVGSTDRDHPDLASREVDLYFVEVDGQIALHGIEWSDSHVYFDPGNAVFFEAPREEDIRLITLRPR